MFRISKTLIAGLAMLPALTAATSADAQELKVGAASNVGGMIVFVAQDKGFFAKHGLNAKVVVRNNGPQ